MVGRNRIFYMDYKLKLKAFNNTDKYKSEMDFMMSLIDPQPNDRIMDYGCGLGTMMRKVSFYTKHIYGYDITDRYYEWEKFNFRMELYFPMDKIYFMHSFAHLPNINNTLINIREKYLCANGQIIILTPNQDWLNYQDKVNYTPDPTVVKHYTPQELRELLTQCGFTILLEGQLGQSKAGASERLFIKAK